MNKILLVDVDSKIPNLALMKLSSYFKKQNKKIELLKLKFDYYSDKQPITIMAYDYEKVYISIIYKINKNKINVIGCSEVMYGGSGYDLTIKLPIEIDNMLEDYSIYNETEYSYGFITRGCIRNCYFCIVPKKEGQIFKYRNIEQIRVNKKLILMDNNILAYTDHLLILSELKEKKIPVQFNQGLDIRLITEENAKELSELNYIGEYYFAFDDIILQPLIQDKLKIIKKYIYKDWKIKFFLYCSPNMSFDSIIKRIDFCKENKVLPYLMRDETCYSCKDSEIYIDLAAYCNQPSIFKKMSYREFIKKRQLNNLERQERFLEVIS